MEWTIIGKWYLGALAAFIIFINTALRSGWLFDKNTNISWGTVFLTIVIFAVSFIGATCGISHELKRYSKEKVLENAINPKPNTRISLQPRGKDCVLVADNTGEATDRNIIIKINFSPLNSISTLNYNKETVILLRGGKPGSNFADFKIKELSPTQQEDIKILLVKETKENPSIEAWSEDKKHIRKIPIITLKWGPEEKYRGD